MLAQNKSGWILLEYLKIKEDEISCFDRVTGAFAVINVKGKYLIGYNPYRQQWEFPAGGIEPGEIGYFLFHTSLFRKSSHFNASNVTVTVIFSNLSVRSKACL